MTKITVQIDTDAPSRYDDHGLLAPPPKKAKIGLVSSIAITAELEKAFKSGVNNDLIKILPKKPDLGYKKNDHSSLQDAIAKYIQKTDLLVTVGGAVAYEAAVEADVADFISLVGNV